MRRSLARALVCLAAVTLPVRLREWGRAMAAELESIERPGAALTYAFGCLAGALRHALAIHLLPATAHQDGRFPMSRSHLLLDHPRRLVAACALGATGLGLAFMSAAGAPPSYLAVNAAALAIGLLAVGALSEMARFRQVGGGLLDVALACLLLLTSLFGLSADGVTRWISAGGIAIQPSLILVPLVALGFAKARDSLSGAAVLISAVALALQPDRAMAGALAAAMAALAVARPERGVLAALAAAVAGLAATIVQSDPSPAVPFVDRIFYTAFEAHPLAGAAVWAGAGLMLVPAVVGIVRDPAHRPAYAVFGAVWLGVLLAAALGNYPTPLVGYGGSAILGYVLAMLGLPRFVAERGVDDRSARSTEREGDQASLLSGMPAAGWGAYSPGGFSSGS